MSDLSCIWILCFRYLLFMQLEKWLIKKYFYYFIYKFKKYYFVKIFNFFIELLNLEYKLLQPPRENRICKGIKIIVKLYISSNLYLIYP